MSNIEYKVRNQYNTDGTLVAPSNLSSSERKQWEEAVAKVLKEIARQAAFEG